jgi:hypothetical protein
MSGDAGLRAELESLKQGELRKRAIEEGASEDAVDEAFEEDDPKQALVQLILDTRELSPSSRAPAAPARESTADMEARIRAEAEARVRAENGAQGIQGALLCSWKIIWNVVVGVSAFLIVLVGLVCKTDGFTGFGCDKETTGPAVILVGLHLWVPAGWVLMGEYRPDTRKKWWSRDNKLLTVGSFVMFYATVMSLSGILCRANSMPGHQDCRGTGFLLILVAIVLMNLGTLTVLGWAVKWNAKRVWLKEDADRAPGVSASSFLRPACRFLLVLPI